MTATEQDLLLLEKHYGGRKAFHGELHDHAATGGTSDGRHPLSHWRGAMDALKMDFAAILDHRQVRHMYLPEWDETYFICGTEPGAKISDSKAENNILHYNMIFDSPAPLEDLLHAFPEYEFEGGPEGHFRYPSFTTEHFGELIDAVKARGGFFVHPHPKQQMKSDDPLDYWFRDETGLEVFYNSMASRASQDNYVLWTTLLSMGKRLWACAGCDYHTCCSDSALTTIYATERRNAAYMPHLRVGDFVCGPVGIKMCIGDTVMGGQCDFTGQRLVLSVGDFHRVVKNPEHNYRLDLRDDRGVLYHTLIPCDKETVLACNVNADSRYVWAEVFDENQNLRIAIGNPIWNAK